MTTVDPKYLPQIKAVTALPYKEQAIFYLNAFWKDGADAEAENVYQLIAAFAKEDHVNGPKGNELNAVQAFNVLQKRNQTLTALQLKAELRKVDIDANGEMALCEYLLFINNRDPVAFVTNPQGEVDPAALKALEDQLAKLNAQFEELQVQLEQQKKAEAEAIAAEKAAIQAEAEAVEAEKVARDAQAKAQKAEDELRAVEEEARVIEAEIKAQEQAKVDEMARLDALTQDQSVGIVKRNMAVQQLAQLKGEDSLPLQKAKLTQEAVVRRLKKATDAAAAQTAIAKDAADKATAAREAAQQKRAQAAQAKLDAEAATKRVEKSIEEIVLQIKEVEVELEKLSKASGTPQGLIWIQQRDLEEKKKSLPTRMW